MEEWGDLEVQDGSACLNVPGCLGLSRDNLLLLARLLPHPKSPSEEEEEEAEEKNSITFAQKQANTS